VSNVSVSLEAISHARQQAGSQFCGIRPVGPGYNDEAVILIPAGSGSGPLFAGALGEARAKWPHASDFEIVCSPQQFEGNVLTRPPGTYRLKSPTQLLHFRIE
jgi:hypothetical protein